MPKKLLKRQREKLDRMKVSPSLRGAMTRHARAKNRSIKHNDEMLKVLGRVKSVSKAHDIAYEKVGN